MQKGHGKDYGDQREKTITLGDGKRLCQKAGKDKQPQKILSGRNIRRRGPEGGGLHSTSLRKVDDLTT